MRAMLLNKIAKKEKELDCLYLELKDYIDSLTIPNKEVKDFVHSLLIYIEQPSCKRILKQFMENYWFALVETLFEYGLIKAAEWVQVDFFEGVYFYEPTQELLDYMKELDEKYNN